MSLVSKGAKDYFFSSIMVMGSLVTASILAEILVRFLLPQNLSGSWTEITDWGYYVNKANARVRHQFSSRVVYYRFNENRLRGGPIQPCLPKALVLGDSYTFGALIEEEATFIQRLQSLADSTLGERKIQFLNGGMVGWSTATYLAFLEQFGETIAPEIVIAFLNTDDIGRSIKNQLYLLENRDTLELKLHMNRLKIGKYKRFFNRLPLYQWFLEHSHLVQFLRVRFVAHFQRKHGDNRFEETLIPVSRDLRIDPAWAIAYGQALFRRMKKWCERRQVKLFVITTGFHFIYDEEGDGMEPTVAFMGKADSIFAQEGIPFKDITTEVRSAIGNDLDAFIIAGDGHPNEAANRVIAESAWSWLSPKLYTARF